jgi:hypothetical protein
MNAVAYKPRITENFAAQVKPKKQELMRIELLGQMDDRHRRALVAGDKQALLELAAEYMMLGYGCPNMANQITAEAESL